MEKRFLLAVVLCFLILMFYQAYQEKLQKPKMPAQETSSPGSGQELPAPSPGAPEAPDAKASLPPAVAASETSVPEQEGGEPVCREVVVDTDLYRAVFCSHNGRPTSWKLKNYQNKRQTGCALLGFLSREASEALPVGDEQNWVERLHPAVPQEFPLALEISTGKERIPVRERLEPDQSVLDMRTADHPARLTFVGRDQFGRAVRRTYTFVPKSYLVNVEIEIAGTEQDFENAGANLTLTERIGAEARDRYTFSGFMGFIDGSLEKEKELKGKEPRYFSGRVDWQGFSDKYFLTCLIPIDNPVSSVKVERPGGGEKDKGGLFVSSLIYNFQDHMEGTVARFSYGLYIGPKDLDVLKTTGYSLQQSIDLGWFGFIARPLLVVLKFFKKYMHNYGVAIILLTVLIKILFYPLTRKQYQSMKELQKLQPKLQEMREKFKGDRERLNKEMMDFYRTHKINPLSGCWPMLLQIPVFFALYRALLNSIELRQAPFMLWIQDLSEKDPCYITPIIMGLTMFLQQRMTPSVGDPNQQRIMMFMPLIFTVMFLQFPSGLVIYWLVNNVLSIGQQYVVTQVAKK